MYRCNYLTADSITDLNGVYYLKTFYNKYLQMSSMTWACFTLFVVKRVLKTLQM